MKRELYNQLLMWKQSKNRKPLIVQGARQVGKTYLINQFGKNEYKDFISLNFEENPDIKTLFEDELSPKVIIENIGLYLGRKISSENTLLFFDEIQAAPKALTSLKYFQEQAKEFHLLAAGSLLGVSIGKMTPFPVGKVNFLKLHPMSFLEYLNAFGEELISDKLKKISNEQPLPDALHKKLLKHLKIYMFLGGMPEVLQDYFENRDVSSSRQIQNEILKAYKNDFSKYSDKQQAIKTSEVWHSIPNQLAKENKKFKYSDVRKKSRASTYQQTIEWLKNAGLINIAYNISRPHLPLSGYMDITKFKVYFLDTGLLGAMLNLSSEIIIEPNELFREYNGAFTENFVATQLIASGIENLFYWTSNSEAEVDFIIQKGNNILPVEVKSGLGKNIKSLRSFDEKYHPEKIYRLSPRNFIKSGHFINVPLYAVNYLTMK